MSETTVATNNEVAYNETNIEATTANSGRIYYLKNSHGDIIGQMDEQGNLLASFAYNAFGELVSAVTFQPEQKEAANRFLYAGEQYDETSGLYYLRARHYDVSAGRFTQEDTYLGDGRNLYAYVHSNPLKYVDPTGHVAETCKEDDGTFLDDRQERGMDGGGGPLSNETLVVRGGLSSPSTLLTNQANDTRGYISANSANGVSLNKLASMPEPFPNGSITTTTVGAIRGIGMDVISDPTSGNPYHAAIVPLNNPMLPNEARALNQLFEPTANIWK